MPNELFFASVDQATAMGYNSISLTPCTGDVFMDKHIFEKLEFLDHHPLVEQYSFFSNFTALSPSQVESLMGLKKLKNITVSIYGHDEESFVAITKVGSKIFDRLLSNLEMLLSKRDQWPFSVAVGFRSTFDVPGHDVGELMHLLRRLESVGVSINSSHGIYNNWGGYVTQDDVAGLNLKVLSADQIYKSGPCAKLFDDIQIMATGIVNGCACRDVDATLRIGDVNEKPLQEILNPHNPEYLKIIEEQERGEFRPVCKSCDYYRSIYHQPSNYRRHGIPVQSIGEYWKQLQLRE